MYFVARRVSKPSIEAMLKQEKLSDNGKQMYLNFSKQLNELINIYFSIEKEGKSPLKRKIITLLTDLFLFLRRDGGISCW